MPAVVGLKHLDILYSGLETAALPRPETARHGKRRQLIVVEVKHINHRPRSALSRQLNSGVVLRAMQGQNNLRHRGINLEADYRPRVRLKFLNDLRCANFTVRRPGGIWREVTHAARALDSATHLIPRIENPHLISAGVNTCDFNGVKRVEKTPG